jgi:hypothetical protein
MHGHQVNLPSIRFYLDVLAHGKTRNGKYAYEQYKMYQAMDDPCFVSITKSISPADGGHTMAIYDATISGATRYLWLYDPNRTWYIDDASHREWYTSRQNYLEAADDGRWSFRMAGGEVWSGSPSSGGNVLVTPISVAGPRSRTITSMGLDALDFLNDFFIYGDGADLKQITDSKGKRLFIPGTKEIDIDPNTGMLNTVPWYPSDGNAPYKFQSYIQLGNPGGPLELDIASSGNGYRLDIAGLRSHMVVEAVGGEGTDRIKVENMGLRSPKIHISNAIGAKSFNIRLSQIAKPRVETRIFHLNHFEIPKDTPIQLQVEDNQRSMQVYSDKADIVYDMTVESIIEGESKTLDIDQLEIVPGQLHSIKPTNWKTLNPDQVSITSKTMKYFQ